MKSIPEAKEDVLKLVNILETQRKKFKTKRSKNLRKFNKVANDFIRCNQTNPAIYKKWQEVQDLMKEMSGGKYDNIGTETTTGQ